MPDYKKLFYKSPIAIDDAIKALENASAQLIACMVECEQILVNSDDFDHEIDDED